MIAPGSSLRSMKVLPATLSAAVFMAVALVLAAPLMFADRAGAQTNPFAVREGASELPAARSPERQQRIAEEAAAPLGPSLDDAAGEDGSSAVLIPFDVNEDGRAQGFSLPSDSRQRARPATTVSPLSNGRQPTSVVPFEATSARERRRLASLLQTESDTLRELRVTLPDRQAFSDPLIQRPIVPDRDLRLAGEIDVAAFTVFLTEAEAARGGTLALGFTNSVLVLPEASRMRLFLNGRQIAQTALDSPDRTKLIALPIPSELLRPGDNAVRLEAQMRHRIDCSMAATYELWTDVDTRLTGLSFGDERPALSGLEELPAVGVGTNGATRLRVVHSGANNPAAVERTFRAVQLAALRGRFAQPLVELAELGELREDGPLEDAPGTLNLVIGVFEAVRAIVPTVPTDGGIGPLVALVDDGTIGPTLIITGPTERTVDAALDRLEPEVSPEPVPSIIAAQAAWGIPTSIPVSVEDKITLREAGVETINFSGRRFRTSFDVTLPPDFYAAAYGEARLLLDAAYADDVEPGSRLSVLVNGVVSTTISFTSRDGEVFDDYPIALVMENFKPGTNRLEIVAELDTRDDLACLPGGTVPTRDRFALFSSTALELPRFARIGQLPNLASFANDAFPYALDPVPLGVRLGEGEETIAAAATLLARIAVSRGASLSTRIVNDLAPLDGVGVLIVAPIDQVPQVALEVTGAAELIPQAWSQPASVPGAAPASEGPGERYDDVLERLRRRISQDDLRSDRARGAPVGSQAGGPRPVAPLADTAGDTLGDLAADPQADPGALAERDRQRWFDELTVGQNDPGLLGALFRRLQGVLALLTDRRGEASTALPNDITVLVTQAGAPAQERSAWTLVTAPNGAALSASIAGLTAAESWDAIKGRAAGYSLADGLVTTVPARDVSYRATMPLSFTNVRLIAANWFSLHNGYYVIALVATAAVLGALTYLLVVPMGRRD